MRIGGLWLLVLTAYSNSFGSGFVLDNRPLIIDDQRVHVANAENVWRIISEGYWPARGTSGLYRPLTTLSYMVNYAILGAGERPQSYHWLNLGIHSANVALAYLLGVTIFESPLPALAFAAIWGVHPLLTESVTNIVGRADLLSAFSVLAGLLCYLRGRASAPMRVRWIAALAVCQLIGLFSKESAVILIPIMLLSDMACLGPTDTRRRVPMFVAAAASCALFFIARMQLSLPLQFTYIDNPLVLGNFWSARLTAIKVLGKYLSLAVWPASLSPDYSFDAISVFSWRFIAARECEAILVLASLLAVVTVLIRWQRTARKVFFFAAFFLVAILPTSNLIVLTGTIMAERFMYLPLLGLSGMFVAALCLLAERWPRSRTLFMRPAPIAAAVCLALALRTYARNEDWRDDASLWASATMACPNSAKAHLNFGKSLLEVPGRAADAIEEYQAALRIDPNYTLAHYSLAVALSRMPGRADESIMHYRSAIRSDPEYAPAHNNLGGLLADDPRRLPEAAQEFREAIRIDPGYAEAHVNLGNALAGMAGHTSEAISEYQTALRLDPNLTIAHFNLGTTLIEIPGRLSDAIREIQLGLRAQPENAAMHNALGAALAASNANLQEAIAEFNEAVRLDSTLREAHMNLGLALLRAPGQDQEAMRELEIAYRLKPDPAVQRMIEQLKFKR